MYLLQPATCLDAKTTAALCLCAAHAVIMLTAELGGAITITIPVIIHNIIPIIIITIPIIKITIPIRGRPLIT